MQVPRGVVIGAAIAILLLTTGLFYLLGKSGTLEEASFSGQTDESVPKMQTTEAVNTEAEKPAKEPPQSKKNETEASPVEESPKLKPKKKTPEPYSKDFTAAETRAIESWWESVEECRGGKSEEAVGVWCPIRDARQDTLNAMGICYGLDHQFPAEYDVHRCGPASIR